jgi:hypothetical protein
VHPDPEGSPERDRDAAARDRLAAARDGAARERDTRAQHRGETRRSEEQVARDEVWDQRVTRPSSATDDPPTRRWRELLEQALVDREIAVSDAEWARRELSAFLDSAHRERGAATIDREASEHDREEAAHDRRRAADDRAAAARDRASASVQQEQAEVDAATRGTATTY